MKAGRSGGEMAYPEAQTGRFKEVSPADCTPSLTASLTSSFLILSWFQQAGAISSCLIHVTGSDNLDRASLLKDLRGFQDVSNQGSWLKFNRVALNIARTEGKRCYSLSTLHTDFCPPVVLESFLGFLAAT